MAVQGACPELEGVQRRKPLLSICIPTYNRARLLESALLALIPQVNEAAGAVELIVSDNYSTDDTETVVQSASSHCQILYSRNAQNEGCARNILRLTNELARGEFAWVLGDDDLVRPDGVQRILTVLEAHPDVDYVFVNLTTSPLKERQRFGRPVTGADFPELTPTKGKSLEDRCVASWEELIDPRVDEVFLGSIMCSVFRLALWRKYELKLPGPQTTFATLAASYPHTVTLAHTMRGRKACYIGYPCVISFWGTQEWGDWVPFLYCVRLQELLNLYRRLGVDKARVEMCRQSLLSRSGSSLQALLLHADTPGREWFSLPVFCWWNRHHLRELRETLRPIVVARLPRRVRVALRATKRGGQMLGSRIRLRFRALAVLIRRPWR